MSRKQHNTESYSTIRHQEGWGVTLGSYATARQRSSPPTNEWRCHIWCKQQHAICCRSCTRNKAMININNVLISVLLVISHLISTLNSGLGLCGLFIKPSGPCCIDRYVKCRFLNYTLWKVDWNNKNQACNQPLTSYIITPHHHILVIHPWYTIDW